MRRIPIPHRRSWSLNRVLRPVSHYDQKVCIASFPRFSPKSSSIQRGFITLLPYVRLMDIIKGTPVGCPILFLPALIPKRVWKNDGGFTTASCLCDHSQRDEPDACRPAAPHGSTASDAPASAPGRRSRLFLV